MSSVKLPKITVLLLSLAACGGVKGDGTAVGNLDGSLRVLTPRSADLPDLSGRVLVTSAQALGCAGGDAEAVEVQDDLSVTGATRLVVPAGTWCGFEFTTSSTARWTGTSSAGFAVDVQLNLGVLTVGTAAPLVAGAHQDLVWQLGNPGWLTAAALGADTADVTLAASDPLAVQLASAARVAWLFDDADDDGQPDGARLDNTDDDDDDTDDDDDDDSEDDDDSKDDDDTDDDDSGDDDTDTDDDSP